MGTVGDHAQTEDGSKEKWLMMKEINEKKGIRNEVKSRKIENTGVGALMKSLVRSVIGR